MRRLSLFPLALLLLAAGCDRRATSTAAVDAPAPTPAAKPAPSPAVEPERKGWLGVVVARESVDVTADSQGRLQAVYVSIGDRVRKGDRLASLDTRIAAQDLEMARSSLQGDEADERRATDELSEAQARNDRRQKNPDFFSKEDLADAALKAKTAGAALEVARSRTAEQKGKIRQLETSLGRNDIRAPFDGQVAERFADSGALVGPGTPVVRLISAGDLMVRAAVPPEEAHHLTPGNPVTATVRTLGLAVPGTIQRIAPEVDAASQMVFIEVRLDLTPGSASRLQTGQVVDVALKPG
ncbi:MAG TPA: efflux RND transporter periplasmic adaptor subunit [Thermoanaerobaculia bacterium]|jgi:RND family efflux transporter MFP subunit|nr:efflux RND transporter periplasmic adaptor subunit [Thermoanaerobaculia bacterium]